MPYQETEKSNIYDFTERITRSKVYAESSPLTDGSLAFNTHPSRKDARPHLTLVSGNIQPAGKTEESAVIQIDKRLQKARIRGEVEHVLYLKSNFYKALNINPKDQAQTLYNYEPWTERAKYERLVADPNTGESQLRSFKDETEAQLITMLRERHSAQKSYLGYSIVDGRMRSAYFPDHDFKEVLLRGVEYQKQNGSKDEIREQKEVEGFDKIEKTLSLDPNVKIGTKVISLSPPSMVPGSPYAKRFIDIFELKEEGGARIVETTRFEVGMEYEDYEKCAAGLIPGYFNDPESPLNSMPLDAYFLSHPIPLPEETAILTPDEIFQTLLKPNGNSLKEGIMDQIINACKPFLQSFINELCKAEVDWGQVALKLNGVLNISDAEKDKQASAQTTQNPQKPSQELRFSTPGTSYFNLTQNEIDARLAHWGRKEVRPVAAGCGLSAGFKVSSGSSGSIAEVFSNSVASFGAVSMGGGGNLTESDQYGSLEFPCPNEDCRKINRRTPGKLQSHCSYCNSSVRC